MSISRESVGKFCKSLFTFLHCLRFIVLDTNHGYNAIIPQIFLINLKLFRAKFGRQTFCKPLTYSNNLTTTTIKESANICLAHYASAFIHTYIFKMLHKYSVLLKKTSGSNSKQIATYKKHNDTQIHCQTCQEVCEDYYFCTNQKVPLFMNSNL